MNSATPRMSKTAKKELGYSESQAKAHRKSIKKLLKALTEAEENNARKQVLLILEMARSEKRLDK